MERASHQPGTGLRARGASMRTAKRGACARRHALGCAVTSVAALWACGRWARADVSIRPGGRAAAITATATAVATPDTGSAQDPKRVDAPADFSAFQPPPQHAHATHSGANGSGTGDANASGSASVGTAAGGLTLDASATLSSNGSFS